MADCIINPSFLTGFDFQLLHAFEGTECSRTMTYDPMRDVFVCGPWNGRQEYILTERATKMTRREDVIPDIWTDNYYFWSGRFGINRHAFVGTTGTDLGGGSSARSFIHTNETDLLTVIAPATAQPNNVQGMAYGGGYFVSFGARSGSPTLATLTMNILQHGENDTGTTYTAGGSSGAIGTVSTARHCHNRGQWVYGALYPETAADIYAGKCLGLGKKAFPFTNSPFTVVDQRFTRLAQFNTDGTAVEVADVIDYPVDFSDGFAMLERDGTMWRVTAADAGGWHKGVAADTTIAGYTFPHLTYGRGRFGESLLVTLDSTGTLGMVSIDGGDSHIVFELPTELGQTIPGGVAVPTGATNDQRLQRCYDLQYISTPEAGNGKGKWILLAGYAVFEMVPRYK